MNVGGIRIKRGLLATDVTLSVHLYNPTIGMAEAFREITPTLFRYHLPERWSSKEREQHAIRAEEVLAALASGKKVEIENAPIQGPFSLRSGSVAGEVSIKRTQIAGPVDWSYATLKQVVTLKGVIFEKEVDCHGITVEKDPRLSFS